MHTINRSFSSRNVFALARVITLFVVETFLEGYAIQAKVDRYH